MTEEHKVVPAGPADTRRRRAWSRPTLTRIEAGKAEVGTRGTGDGPFTTS